MNANDFKEDTGVKRIERNECVFPERLMCHHTCQEVLQFYSRSTGDVKLEICLNEARTLSFLLLNETIKRDKKHHIHRLQQQEKEDNTVWIGDIFKVVRENNHETPYLIHVMDGHFYLTNLHSGQTNYKALTIDKLIQHYFSLNKNSSDANPITHYYFIKSYHHKSTHDQNFGLTEIN